MKENVALPSPPSLPPSSSSISPSVSSEPAVPLALPVKRRSWPLMVGGGVLALGFCLACAALGAYSHWASSDFIAPGVTIAGVPVGGLTPQDAQAQLESRFGALPVTLQTDARPFHLTLSELGGLPSIAPTVGKARKIGRDGTAVANFLRVYGSKTAGQRFMLPIQWNEDVLMAKLNTIDHLYAKSPLDARLIVGQNGVEIVPGQTGKSLEIRETASQIQKKYFVGVREIAALTQDVAPKIAASDLAGQDVLLASYKTHYNGGIVGRTTNIHVACNAIDGTVLMPGETFSFNSLTGERTFGKGYRMAHIFETKPGQTEAEVVDGLAGGVCQVSSTLFNAVRKTNAKIGAKRLKIVERNTHSLPVTYVPRGLDATVAWPSKDFRFRNTFEHPIYIRIRAGNSNLSIGIWGRVSAEKALLLTTAPRESTSNE